MGSEQAGIDHRTVDPKLRSLELHEHPVAVPLQEFHAGPAGELDPAITNSIADGCDAKLLQSGGFRGNRGYRFGDLLRHIGGKNGPRRCGS